MCNGESKAAATTKMELFLTIVIDSSELLFQKGSP